MSVLNFLKEINSPYLTAYQRDTLGQQVEELKDPGESGLQHLLEKINKSDQDTQASPKNPEYKKTLQKEIPLDFFQKCNTSKECIEYLEQRKVQEYQDLWYFSTQKFFTLDVEGISKTVYLLDYLLIPIINEQGKYRGFYSRSIKEKRFSTFLLPNTTKIWLKNPLEKPSHIFEGIFDAISGNFPNPAAMLGAGLETDYLRTLSKDVIFVFDNDHTGIKKAIEYAGKGFGVFVWPDDPDCDFKDINEMLVAGKSKEQITNLISENIYYGIQAKTRLKMKER
jgi:hypothetical protein